MSYTPKTLRVSKRGLEKVRVMLRNSASVNESGANHAAPEASVAETGRVDFQDSDDTDHSSVASHKNKKAKVVTDLTEEEEESMIEWLKAYPILYNKKLQAYKDTAKKEKLWVKKATQMGKSVLVLKTWYTSLRSRFGRLKKKRFGDEVSEAEMTERDLWVVRRFQFLCPHIYEVQKKTPVSMKQKLSAASETPTTPDIVIDKDNSDTSRSPPTLTPSTVVSSTPRSRQMQTSTKSEEALLARLEEHNQQIVALQQQVMDRLKASTDRERDAFVDWTKSVILDLDHSIWRRCQRDISQILYRYISENDQLKRQLTPFHSAAPTLSTVSIPAGSTTGQLAPLQSPQPTSQVSVWHSQDGSWFQQQFPQQQYTMTQVLPMRPASAPPINTPMAPSPIRQADNSHTSNFHNLAVKVEGGTQQQQ